MVYCSILQLIPFYDVNQLTSFYMEHRDMLLPSTSSGRLSRFCALHVGFIINLCCQFLANLSLFFSLSCIVNTDGALAPMCLHYPITMQTQIARSNSSHPSIRQVFTCLGIWPATAPLRSYIQLEERAAAAAKGVSLACQPSRLPESHNSGSICM